MAKSIDCRVKICGQFPFISGHINEWYLVSGLLLTKNVIRLLSCNTWNRISASLILLKLKVFTSNAGVTDLIVCGGRLSATLSVFN